MEFFEASTMGTAQAGASRAPVDRSAHACRNQLPGRHAGQSAQAWQASLVPELGGNRRQSRQGNVNVFPIRRIPASTRPAPFRCPSAQPSSYRILMEVVHRAGDSLRTVKVSVVSRTFLPVTQRLDSRPLADRHSPLRDGRSENDHRRLSQRHQSFPAGSD